MNAPARAPIPRYPDKLHGARALLRDESDLPDVDRARGTPDPGVRGCWLLADRRRRWRALVYVADHPLAPDFELVDD